MLLGPISVDRYLDERLVLPGGGALNMAYHWSRLGVPFHFLTRIGSDEAPVVLSFLQRHAIEFTPELVVSGGTTASIDIVIGDDRQPWMDNFVPGVWRDLRLSAAEESALCSATHAHAVLVDPVVSEVHRLGDADRLDGVAFSGDFLSFRRYSVERFTSTMQHLSLGFIGWPGDADDARIAAIRDVAFDLHRVVVVTMGARSTLVFDGRDRPIAQEYPINAVSVRGTTVGCGDAFIAAFLASWWCRADLTDAVHAGQRAGASATAWRRPLPDEAYGR